MSPRQGSWSPERESSYPEITQLWPRLYLDSSRSLALATPSSASTLRQPFCLLCSHLAPPPLLASPSSLLLSAQLLDSVHPVPGCCLCEVLRLIKPPTPCSKKAGFTLSQFTPEVEGVSHSWGNRQGTQPGPSIPKTAPLGLSCSQLIFVRLPAPGYIRAPEQLSSLSRACTQHRAAALYCTAQHPATPGPGSA